jgi:hypothetical protein
MAAAPSPGPSEEAVKEKAWKNLSRWVRGNYVAIVQLAIAVVTAGAAIGALWFSHQALQVTKTAERATDQWARAKELTESQDPSFRAGGLYTLGEIAQDSPADQPMILEVLSAFVRTHAPLTPDCSRPSGPNTRLAVDVQAALTALGQLGGTRDHQINLSQTCLQGADLTRAKLAASNLANANLSYASLTYADLNGANLTGTQLTSALMAAGTRLTYANLSDADLTDAIMPTNPDTYLRNITYNANTKWPNDFTPPPSQP